MSKERKTSAIHLSLQNAFVAAALGQFDLVCAVDAAVNIFLPLLCLHSAFCGGKGLWRESEIESEKGTRMSSG
jgi:hypothetical protein